jgi:hypothetical protein
VLQVTYNVSTAYLGTLLFVANLIAAVSSLLSGWVAAKLGLINTMVFTHLPSNVLVILIPIMPNLHLATAMVFLRFTISQVCTRAPVLRTGGAARSNHNATRSHAPATLASCIAVAMG